MERALFAIIVAAVQPLLACLFSRLCHRVESPDALMRLLKRPAKVQGHDDTVTDVSLIVPAFDVFRESESCPDLGLLFGILLGPIRDTIRPPPG